MIDRVSGVLGATFGDRDSHTKAFKEKEKEKEKEFAHLCTYTYTYQ